MVSQQDSLSAAIKRIDVDSQISEEDRMEALLSAYRLIARLETPWEFVLRQGMNQVARSAFIHIVAISSDYTIASTRSSFENIHRSQFVRKLARFGGQTAERARCGTSVFLCSRTIRYHSTGSELIGTFVEIDLGRLLRHLAANNILQETTTGHFQPTNLSISFTQPVFREWINHMQVPANLCFETLLTIPGLMLRFHCTSHCQYTVVQWSTKAPTTLEMASFNTLRIAMAGTCLNTMRSIPGRELHSTMLWGLSC